MKEVRSHTKIRLAAVKRMFMWNFMSKRLDLVLISEHPKSGGSWLSEMLRELLDIPFPRNVSPTFEPCILHGHHTHNLAKGKMIGLLRDGRDVMVSAYYHFLIENERNPSFFVKRNRNILKFENYSDIRRNMPSFIKFMFNNYAKEPFHHSWVDYVNAFVGNKNTHLVKYEDLLSNGHTTLRGILKFLDRNEISDKKIESTLYNHNFDRQKKTIVHKFENSFLRKGKSGDWVNHFDEESCRLFHKYAGEALIKAQYEVNDDWIWKFGEKTMGMGR